MIVGYGLIKCSSGGYFDSIRESYRKAREVAEMPINPEADAMREGFLKSRKSGALKRGLILGAVMASPLAISALVEYLQNKTTRDYGEPFIDDKKRFFDRASQRGSYSVRDVV